MLLIIPGPESQIYSDIAHFADDLKVLSLRCRSVRFRLSGGSNSAAPWTQRARLHCPLPAPGVHPNNVH